jgi:probable rRNA maturation factor
MTVRVAGPSMVRSLPTFDRALLEARARALLRELGHGESELSISLVGDEEMAGLNQRFRAEAAPTDVLSFSLLEGDHTAFHGDLLGEVVIDVEVAARQASTIGHGLDAEMARLLIHGTLHLLGHDHQQEEEARAMEAAEDRLWAVVVA